MNFYIDAMASDGIIVTRQSDDGRTMREPGNGLWVKRKDALWEWRTDLTDDEINTLKLDVYTHMGADDGEEFLTPVGEPYPSTVRRLISPVPFMSNASFEQEWAYRNNPKDATTRDIREYLRERDRPKREAQAQREARADLTPAQPDDDEPLVMPERDARERRADDRFKRAVSKAMLEWLSVCEDTRLSTEQQEAVDDMADTLVDGIICLVYSEDEGK